MAPRSLRKCLDCRAGGIALATAIVMPLLLGFGALGVEVSSWYLKQRAMQGAADAAAISAAAAYLAGDDPVAVGHAYAASNGWADGAESVNVTITPAPAASPPHIDADIAQPQAAILSAFLHGVTLPIVRAHARVILVSAPAGSRGCLIGLSTSAPGGAVQISGQGYINAPTCVIVSNTNTATAGTNCLNVNPPCISLSNNAGSGINVAELDVATRAPFSCPAGGNGVCTITTRRDIYPLWARDPFAERTMPTAGACPGSDPSPTTSATGVKTYSAGTYCHGISISSASANIVFGSGIYFLGGTNSSGPSSLSITGGAINQTTVSAGSLSSGGSGYKKNDVLTITGGAYSFPTTVKVNSVNTGGAILTFTVTSGAYQSTPTNPAAVTGGTGSGAKFNMTYASPPSGITFVLTGPAANSIGTVSLSNATMTFAAPTTGATAGILFWQDKRATGSSGLSGNPSATVSLTGALYFPNTNVAISGNSTFAPTDCTAIVANVISFTGQGSISNGCLGITGGGGGSMHGYRMAE